ncbi:hypothetical protein JZM24_16160 [Candidatus Sodalis endolongispinus]|uniref:Uncharacterized protein n=1 Tax=Candidatus Sodalis endolongispinus TaxID=2812662 RepID=A0ABS5YDZ6_9GAMM|nr:hypothetical protein [Candidatus Sodalis endolongispinus]MBT9433265.1 hypothetical protein [Candidatus Sodalis endolongispinus]
MLLMRPQTWEAWDDRLGYCIQSALRTTAGALAHRGGLLSFQPVEGRWTLLLSAAPAPMMGALAGAIDRLRSLTAAEYQHGLWRRQADWLQREADIPARALLQALAQWLDRTLTARDESLFPVEKPRLDGLHWQALLYGSESTPLARLLSPFPGSIVPPASPAVAPLPPNAWLQVSSLHSEAALLVFAHSLRVRRPQKPPGGYWRCCISRASSSTCASLSKLAILSVAVSITPPITTAFYFCCNRRGVMRRRCTPISRTFWRTCPSPWLRCPPSRWRRSRYR